MRVGPFNIFPRARLKKWIRDRSEFSHKLKGLITDRWGLLYRTLAKYVILRGRIADRLRQWRNSGGSSGRHDP